MIILDDGSVWTQTDDWPGLDAKIGKKVTVKRGVLGSYWLSIPGQEWNQGQADWLAGQRATSRSTRNGSRTLSTSPVKNSPQRSCRGENHRELMFLSDEHFADNFQKVTHPAAAIASHVAEARQAPIHFIFHTAFCCSTLMLKAIDIPGRTLGLKEPDILINLANRFIRSDDQGNGERLDLVLHLLARPFEAGESIIVKPTNFANRLAMPVLEARPDSRAVLLYSDVRPLLRSILKRGMWGRIWGRRLFRSAAGWASLHFGFSEEDTFVLTDLQALGLGWLMQMHHFSEVAHQMGDRVIMIDSADFLEGPGPTLQRVSDLFELGSTNRKSPRS